jgi:catechol 2,3-dioxygenase-like lactoylglutathione lyase family enzyme
VTQDLARPVPRPPAAVAVYVEVLGPELALHFLLTFGGAELVLPAEPRATNQVATLVGIDRARALAARIGPGVKHRVPLAKSWVAAMLAWQGPGTAAIARRLHVSDVTVRTWQKAARVRAG